MMGKKAFRVAGRGKALKVVKKRGKRLRKKG